MAKFCAGCGAPLADNEKFCGSCGTKVEDTIPVAQNAAAQENSQNDVQNVNNVQNVQDQQNVQNFQQPDYGSPLRDPAPKAPNPALTWVKGHKNLLIIAAAGIVVIVAAVIILMNIFKYQVIDPKDIASVQFYGVNGDGSAEVCLNNLDVMKSYYQKLVTKDDEDNYFDYDFYTEKIKGLKEEDCSKYFESKKAWTKAKNSSEAKKMQKALLKENDGEYKIKFELENKTGLKNGDKVKVTVDYDKDYLKENKIKLSSDSFEVEVEGLEDAEDYDMFKDVSIESSGYNGVATLVYDTYYAENYVHVNAPENGIFNYTVKDSDGEKKYSNGDTIKITAKLNTGKSTLHKRKDGYWFKDGDKFYKIDKAEDTKEIEVSGLQDTQELDIFKDLKFNYDGAAPNLKVYSPYLSDDTDYSGCISYKIVGNAEELKIKDKFKVVACVYPESLGRKGYTVSGDPNSDVDEYFDGDSYYSSYSYDDYENCEFYSKEFTVDDSFAHYITTKEDAMAAELDSKNYDDENVFENAVKDIKTELKNYSYVQVYKSLEDSVYVEDIKKITGCTYVGSCLSYSSKAISDAQNYVVRIYKVTVVDEDNKSHKFYTAAYVSDMYKNPEGVYKNSYSTFKMINYTSPQLIYKDFAKNDGGKLTVVKYKNKK